MLTKEKDRKRDTSINQWIKILNKKKTAHSSVPKSLTTKPDRINSVPIRRKSINLKLKKQTVVHEHTKHANQMWDSFLYT